MTARTERDRNPQTSPTAQARMIAKSCRIWLAHLGNASGGGRSDIRRTRRGGDGSRPRGVSGSRGRHADRRRPRPDRAGDVDLIDLAEALPSFGLVRQYAVPRGAGGGSRFAGDH